MAKKHRSYARVDQPARIAAYRECVAAGMTAAETAKKLGITLPNLYVWRSDLKKRRRIKLPPTNTGRAQIERPRMLARKPVELTFVLDVSVAEPALN